MEIKPPQFFIDTYGTLDAAIHKGGDSCQRVGMYWSLFAMISKPNQVNWAVNKTYLEQMKLHHVSDGVMVRHPNLEWDTSDFDRMSRDQLQPIIIAAGYWSKLELNKITKGHLKRGFLFTNNTRQNGATKRNHGTNGYSYTWKFPDPTLFEIWGNFIRAYRAWYLWPLLLLFDLELLGGAFKWRFFPKHNIAMNHTLSLFQAIDRYPTPLSWLARVIMPPARLIALIHDHFDDFDTSDKGLDMQFFSAMFKDAYEDIK